MDVVAVVALYPPASSGTFQRFMAEPELRALRPRILIVEDFDDARELYAMFFADAGFEVTEASNGVEALESVAAARPDYIVMDLAMPVMDGFEATRRLKSEPTTAGILIVVVSGHAKRDDIARAREAGADALLAKPCLPADLRIEIERLVRDQRRSRPQDAIRGPEPAPAPIRYDQHVTPLPGIPRSIVVADDDADTRELYVRCFTDIGFRVEAARNGAELVELSQSARFDAFVIDLRMPIMDGWEAIQHVRAAVGPEPYILVVSAHIDAGDMRDLAYDAGADDVIGKPITPEVLLAVVRAALGARP